MSLETMCAVSIRIDRWALVLDCFLNRWSWLALMYWRYWDIFKMIADKWAQDLQKATPYKKNPLLQPCVCPVCVWFQVVLKKWIQVKMTGTDREMDSLSVKKSLMPTCTEADSSLYQHYRHHGTFPGVTRSFSSGLRLHMTGWHLTKAWETFYDETETRRDVQIMK